MAVGVGDSCCRRLSLCAGASFRFPASVSAPRSSNRTCRFSASGSPMGFTFRPAQVTCAAVL